MTDTAKAAHSPNPPSQAIQVEAGSDQVVHVGETVQLSGSTTAQNNNNIQWHFKSVPAGSTAELLDADTLTPRFVPDLAGLYVVALVKNRAQTDEVTVDYSVAAVASHAGEASSIVSSGKVASTGGAS